MLLGPEKQLLAEARRTTRTVARTFAIAVRLLPREVRDDVYLLYLVFRTLDDLVDEGRPQAAARVGAVEAWCRGGVPATTEARILDDLERRHPIPRDAVAEFCAGMRTDLDFSPPRTEAELDTYCYRVAGTVGVVMAALLGTDGDPAQAHRAAAALGMAMQRTNILRDIDEDRGNGRVYLAEESLHRFGAADPGRRERLLRDQIARADALYDEGIAGIVLLRSGGRAIRAAAAMYREILRQIEREGYGAREGRAVVSRRRKLAVAARRGLVA
ncbi:MAG: phytoene/squalene synthetase [Solirubrobacterales bacterium]|jgi:phytoene synthase|nr:phytoene/squalene synthetase [Solirubrobacterales bacterium]